MTVLVGAVALRLLMNVYSVHVCFVRVFYGITADSDIYTLSLHDALPISRSIADSRRRSSTDNDNVLATPTSAMTTDTASRAITMSSNVSMTCSYAARSTPLPPSRDRKSVV